MNKAIYLSTISIFLLLVSLTSCSKDCIKGNGDQKLENREVGAFSKIRANSSFKINYTRADNYRCDVFAESNVLPFVKTTVDNQTLSIDLNNENTDNDCFTLLPVEVTLTSPDLKEISTSGDIKLNVNIDTLDEMHVDASGSIDMTGVLDIINRLFVNVSGTGVFNLVGSAGYTEFNISGIGNVHTENMVQDSCKIDFSGSGDIYVKVNKYLKVKITGAGTVFYYGNPDEIIANISGTGNLIKMGSK